MIARHTSDDRGGSHLQLMTLTFCFLILVLGAVLMTMTSMQEDTRDPDKRATEAQREQRAAEGREEVQQFGRAGFDLMQRELDGVFLAPAAEAATAGAPRGLRVYHTDAMGPNAAKRAGTQGLAFCTAGIRSFDPREVVDGNPNPFFGHPVHCVRVAYYLNNETDNLARGHLFRCETPDLTGAVPPGGTPFVRCCLDFHVRVLSPFGGEESTAFRATDWDSDGRVTVAGNPRRRGLPEAIEITMRVTDRFHAERYRWDDTLREWRLPDGETDDAVRTFRRIIYFGRRID